VRINLEPRRRAGFGLVVNRTPRRVVASDATTARRLCRPSIVLDKR